MKQTKISLSQLEKFLDGAANILRGGVDASEYKEFIFGMMFIKRLSDQFDQHKAEIIEKYTKMGLDAEQIKDFSENKAYYGDKFFVPEIARWANIKDLKANIASNLDLALAAIEENNDEMPTCLLKWKNGFIASRSGSRFDCFKFHSFTPNGHASNAGRFFERIDETSNTIT